MKKIIFLIIISLGFSKTISLATENWPPFSYYDKNHKVVGFSTEVIENTFKIMHVKISSIKIFPWARTEKLGFLGKFDGVYTASKNKIRQKYMYFPKEDIIKSKWVLFAVNKNLKFSSFKDLKNKRFCLIRSYNYPKDFKKYILKNAKITYTSTEVLNIKKLLYNRCDYMPAVLETTNYLINHNPELKKLNASKLIYAFKKPLLKTSFYLMFSKKRVSKEFVEQFSKALAKFKKTSKYKELKKKYL